MRIINFDPNKHAYIPETKTFSASEKDVPFDTRYELKSPNGGSRIFNFSHSTGPEFDPKTRWVYKSEDGEFTLEVCNDPKITELLARNYLAGKLKK